MNKILLIEDDNGVREAMQYALQYAGYMVWALANGNNLLAEPPPGDPDLFIIDKQLSGIDGLDICRHLRKQEIYRLTPVIIISANPNVANMIRDMEDIYFLEKPFPLAKLKHIVAQHLL